MRRVTVFLVALAVAVALGASARAEPVVLAAASTNRAVDAALEASGIEAVTSYAASGVLARQIEQGMPADLFISANPKWMRHLAELGLVEQDDIVVLMSNALVLIAPPDGPDWDALPVLDRLEGEVFVMADPATAPVGAYGQAALETLGLWAEISPAFVPMRNTLGTVAAVSAGEAALGLVYASDAAGQDVRVIREIPTESHPAIQYLMAPLTQGDDADGGSALLAYLASAEGSAVLAESGFLVGAAP